MKLLRNHTSLIQKIFFVLAFIVCCGLNLHMEKESDIEIKDLDKVFEIARKMEENSEEGQFELAIQEGEYSY